MPEPIPNPVDGGCLAWVERLTGVGVGGGAGAAGRVPVRAHRWVAAASCPDGPVDAAVATWAGRVLARLHGLAVRATDRTVFPVTTAATADRWPELVTIAREKQARWAGLAAAALPAARLAAELLAEAEAAADPSAEVMSHGDVDQKNLLLSASGPVLCDWDVAAPVTPRVELADAALSLAAWERFDLASEVVRAYRAAGGGDWPIRPADLGRTLVVSLDWIAFNVERALGMRPAAADEAAASATLVPRLLAELPRRVHAVLRVDSLLR